MHLPAKPTLADIARLSQPNPSAEAIGARAVHISAKMSDLPHTYRNLLPTTADPSALTEAEAAIRAIHAQDAAQHAAMNTPEPQAPDINKLSPRAKIELGLKMGKPQGVATAIDPAAFGRAGGATTPEQLTAGTAQRRQSRMSAKAALLEGLTGKSNAGSFL